MHTIKKYPVLLTYYLNICVQAANLSDCRIESKKIDSVAKIESKVFLPELKCFTPTLLVRLTGAQTLDCNCTALLKVLPLTNREVRLPAFGTKTTPCFMVSTLNSSSKSLAVHLQCDYQNGYSVPKIPECPITILHLEFKYSL